MVNNGSIYNTVSVHDIQTVLRTKENDIGALCRHDNINMWSKHKPVTFSDLFRFPDKNNIDERLYCAGIYYGGTEDIPANVATYTGPAWSYWKPTGSSTSPYRITDFNGYYHYAVCPFVIECPSSFSVSATGSVTLKVDGLAGLYTGDAYGNNLKFNDIFPTLNYNNWRPTLAIVNTGDRDGNNVDPLYNVDEVIRYYFCEHVLNDNPSTGYEIPIKIRQSDDVLHANYYYTGVVMLTNHSYYDNVSGLPYEYGIAADDIDQNTKAVTLACGNDNDRFIAKYEDNEFTPGNISDPDVTGTWYFSNHIGLDHVLTLNNDVTKYEVTGLETWVVHKVGGVNRLFNQGDIPLLQFKITAVVSDYYQYDDNNEGGTYNLNGYISGSGEITIVDWTLAVENTNIDWDSTEQCYLLELYNYFYQAPNGNNHKYIYLDNTSFPHTVSINLYMKYAQQPGIGVYREIFTIQSNGQSVYISRNSNGTIST